MSGRMIARLIVYGIPVGLLGGCIVYDLASLRRVRPPRSMTTLEDFKLWNGEKIMGKATYENGGTNYIVMLGPAGRALASGPSAYLFNTNGQFVDWTSDMGDIYTIRYGFRLNGGVLKNIERKKVSGR